VGTGDLAVRWHRTALPLHLGVPRGDKTLVALWFETDRAPFVVKNPEGGAITREVTWREGTAIRSATREISCDSSPLLQHSRWSKFSMRN
jgi:hypothetical protein